MPDIDGNPTDRLKESVTSPYPTHDTEWDALLTAIAKEFEELDAVREDILTSKFVDDATGEQLDKLASIFQLERDSSFTTEEFRQRIKVALRSQLASGTIDEIEETIAVLLDDDIENVTVVETTDLEPATIQLDVDESQFDTSILADVADDLVAAGVDVGIRVVINRGDTLVADDGHTTDFPEATETVVLTDAATTDFPTPDETVAVVDEYTTEFPTRDEGTAIADAHTVPSITQESDSAAMADATAIPDAVKESGAVAISDAVSIPDAVKQAESVAVSDTVATEFTEVTQSYWNEGIWNSSTDVW